MGRGTAWNIYSNLQKQIHQENVTSCWLYFRYILAKHGHMNVKKKVLWHIYWWGFVIRIMNFRFDKMMGVSHYRHNSNFWESLKPMQNSYIVEWIDLSQEWCRWRALVNRVIWFVFPKMHVIPQVAGRMQLLIKDFASCN